MSETSEHLKTARRLHFQGNTGEAIREYEYVLELDPNNPDAINGLRSLGVEPVYNESAHNTGLKSNFFAKQAEEGASSGIKNAVFKCVIIALAGGTAYGLYVFGTYFMNYENIQACEKVVIGFERPQIKDGKVVVNVKVVNTNPCPVKDMVIGYKVSSGKELLREGTFRVKGFVPAGDRRTFDEVTLGEVNGTPDKLSGHVESLTAGKKYKLKDKYVNKFVEAAQLKDKDAEYYYEELTQEAEDFPPAFIGYGRALAARSKYDDALDQYKKALELDPYSSNAHYYSAVALFYKGDRDGAKKEIEQAATLAPEDPEILWNQKYLLSMKDPAKKVIDKNKKDKESK